MPVVAAKSYFGNLGAGSGVVELIASVKALQHNRLFHTLNYEMVIPPALWPSPPRTTTRRARAFSS